MKTKLLAIAIAATSIVCTSARAAPPPGYCEVQICNKLSRFSLDPWSHIKDSMGEQCMPALLSIADSVQGKKLSSETRWYQGSFNPTKSSVTKVKSVGQCTAAPVVPPAPAAATSAPTKK